MEPVIWIWLGLLVLFLVIELATVSLTTIWFAGGALVALIFAVTNLPVWAQITVFVVVSILLLIFTRPVLKKLLKTSATKTNVESLIGMTAKVTEDINNINNTGAAIVNGQEWTARTASDEETIEKDSTALITGIEGVKLILTGVAKKGE